MTRLLIRLSLFIPMPPLRSTYALFVLVFLCLVAGGAALRAQLRVQPVAELPGDASLELLLRKLSSSGTFMETTAHPDDENNALLAMLGLGEGMRTVLVSATRGDGGQNEIGPELFTALGVLRTEELLAVHRFDGAEQYFTRAVDFGFSFSVEETLEKWGREEILADFVRHIRTLRPDVIAGFLCGGEGGGQHHQASAKLTTEAFRAAADPTRFPEQLQAGLRPWLATRVFCTDISGFGPRRADTPLGPDMLVVDTSRFDGLLGRTYAELGLEARSMHKCQGTSQLLLLPGETQNRTYRLTDSVTGDPGIAPASMFAGIDTSLPGLVRFAPGQAAALTPALTRIAAHVADARGALASGGAQAAVRPLASGLEATRQLRTELAAAAHGDSERLEVDERLARKEIQFEQALVIASGLRLDVLADDGLVVPEQSAGVVLHAASHSEEGVQVRNVAFAGAEGGEAACAGTVARSRPLRCAGKITIPADASLSTPYWKTRADAARYDFETGVPFGSPFTPTPFAATVDMIIAGQAIRRVQPVEFRYGDIVAGEKRMELQVVPPFAATVTPEITVVPAAAASRRTVDVRVTNHTRGAARATLALQVPAGWSVEPLQAPLAFTREDEEATTAFVLVPPARLQPGEWTVEALVRGDGTEISSSLGFEVIEYPHTRRRHVVHPSRTRLKVIDVAISTGLRIGYIMGVGDQVPRAIEGLGADVRLISPGELASGDLSAYDAIVTGVRAYERRADLRANNHRLIAYAAGGGTVLVQYNKFEFNEAQYGPYPAQVSAGRVTDETAPVEHLVPDHPVFTTPNRIGPGAWAGWVQERGLYFLGERDARYTDLVRSADPFPFNSGPRTGALVEARVGNGRWIYIGLGLWRQLPAGTDGAYQLMANLLSLGKAR